MISKLTAILRNPKIQVMLVGATVATAARLGFDLDAELVLLIVGLFAGTAGGMTVVERRRARRDAAPADSTRPPEAGMVAFPVLLSIAMILATLLIATQGGCGPTAREQTLRAALIATDAASATFTAWDLHHQETLVTTAVSESQGRERIEGYRARRARVVDLFEGTYRAIAAAAVLEDDPTSMPNLTKAAALLAEALKDLTGGKLP